MAYDAYGNLITNYTGTVHFSSTDPAAVLPADSTFTASDRGVQSFPVTLGTAGNQTLTATDTATNIHGSATVQVLNYIPGLHFTESPTATSVAAGTPFGFTVTAWDDTGHVATHYVGTVTFSSSDHAPGVVLPANYTFTAADAGVHTFSATLVTADPASVSFYDPSYQTSGGSGGGSGGPGGVGGTISLTVTPAPASTLVANGFPVTTTAGNSESFTVTAKDPYGNVATGYTGTIHFTSSDPLAVLPADYTFTSSDHGVHTFNVALETAGLQSITDTDTTSSSLSGFESGITVTAAAASSFAVSGFPSLTTAGTTGTFTVTTLDAYGNVASGYLGTVQFTSSDAQAVLPADYTFTAADQGVHTFTVALDTAGMQSLSVSDLSAPAITGSQAGIAVSPAQATQIVISYPADPQAGVAFTVVVSITDNYGNVVPNWTGTVDFQSSDPQAVLPADYTYTAADQGLHVFDLTLSTLGPQTVQITDTAGVLYSWPLYMTVVS